MAKGSNSLGLVRQDFIREDASEDAGSTLLAIGTEKTLLKYIAANIPDMRREGKFLYDAAGNTYHVSWNTVELIERMESAGSKLPFTF